MSEFRFCTNVEASDVVLPVRKDQMRNKRGIGVYHKGRAVLQLQGHFLQHHHHTEK